MVLEFSEETAGFDAEVSMSIFVVVESVAVIMYSNIVDKRIV